MDGSPQQGTGQCGIPACVGGAQTPQRIWVLKDAFLVMGAAPAVATEMGGEQTLTTACDEEGSRDILGQFLGASPGGEGVVAAGWCETFIAGWFLQHWNLSCPAKEGSSRVLLQHFVCLCNSG